MIDLALLVKIVISVISKHRSRSYLVHVLMDDIRHWQGRKYIHSLFTLICLPRLLISRVGLLFCSVDFVAPCKEFDKN